MFACKGLASTAGFCVTSNHNRWYIFASHPKPKPTWNPPGGLPVYPRKQPNRRLQFSTGESVDLEIVRYLFR
jgi:hypothetical protein